MAGLVLILSTLFGYRVPVSNLSWMRNAAIAAGTDDFKGGVTAVHKIAGMPEASAKTVFKSLEQQRVPKEVERQSLTPLGPS